MNLSPRKDPVTSRPATDRKNRVSIIDDDAAVRASLSDLLDAAGCQPMAYPDGESFLSSPSALASDVVITDIHMPGMDGLALMDRLKELSRKPIPVIVITANTDERIKTAARRKGCFAYLRKPCDPSVLVASVHQALSG